MLIYAGIDEAGYGPLLGPLCVAASVFVLREHHPDAGAPKMWGMLKHAICRAGRDRRGHIAIDDSKKLKGANDGNGHPLRRLERGVLAFLLAQEAIESDEDLYQRLGVRTPACGWYKQPCMPLPLANLRDELKIAAARLARTLERAEIACHGIHCEAIDAPDFNAQVGRMGTKAAVNLCAALRLIDRIWRTFPGDHPRIVVDRHGGRTHYREDLALAWPDAMVIVLAENDTLSRYRLELGGRRMTLTFTVAAEEKHLPVALASMTAKYVRELLMLRLNRFFQQHLPELKPTAGYYQDGRRFVEEVEPVIDKMRIDRRELVRVC